MGNVTVIVGLQWGNEGKGRIAHHVSRDCIAIRATSGSGAGHTVMIGGQKVYSAPAPCGNCPSIHQMHHRSWRGNRSSKPSNRD